MYSSLGSSPVDWLLASSYSCYNFFKKSLLVNYIFMPAIAKLHQLRRGQSFDLTG